jgi:hypothetical protein
MEIFVSSCRCTCLDFFCTRHKVTLSLCGVNITVKNTTVVNGVDYLFSGLLHVSAHVTPSSGTLEVNYTKYTAFNIMHNGIWHIQV